MTLEVNELGFDFNVEVEHYREGASDLIHKLIPPHFLDVQEHNLLHAKRSFQELLPLFSYSDLSKAPCSLSLLLLSKYRQNGPQFFYELIRLWLLPQKVLPVELFFAANIRLPHLSPDLLNVAELVVQIRGVHEMERIKKNIRQIETELRLGIASHYHARRILEFKGLSSDGKTVMIQEKIRSLIQNRSTDFDRELFSQMQHFLVSCPETFKKERDHHHISRIISNLHSLRTQLKQSVSQNEFKRNVILKFLKTKLTKTSSPVLGILVGLTLQKDQERFEENHLIDALKQLNPSLRVVARSFFSDSPQEPFFQMNYLEIEKEEGCDFSHPEIQFLRERLPSAVKAHIEQLTHPIFMPRNEEEVLRNIMILSQQIRFVSDLPQFIISFDEQRTHELSFTVVIVRVLKLGALPLKELFAQKNPTLDIVFDRVRKLGTLGKKQTKEAAVLRINISSRDFLRTDRSVDLYKARQKILAEFSRILGDIRDYNGGIITKQNELFSNLKKALGRTAETHASLLEKFFFSLTPVELRSTQDVNDLKQLFLLLLHAQKCDLFQESVVKETEDRVFYVHPQASQNLRKSMNASLDLLTIPHGSLISFSIDVPEAPCIGFLLRDTKPEQREGFLTALRSIKPKKTEQTKRE